jgi:hypothetical protein
MTVSTVSTGARSHEPPFRMEKDHFSREWEMRRYQTLSSSRSRAAPSTERTMRRRSVARRRTDGGMEVSDARPLKALEDENRRLKKLLAESMLDASTLKEMLEKNF